MSFVHKSMCIFIYRNACVEWITYTWVWCRYFPHTTHHLSKNAIRNIPLETQIAESGIPVSKQLKTHWYWYICFNGSIWIYPKDPLINPISERFWLSLRWAKPWRWLHTKRGLEHGRILGEGLELGLPELNSWVEPGALRGSHASLEWIMIFSIESTFFSMSYHRLLYSPGILMKREDLVDYHAPKWLCWLLSPITNH